MSLITRYLKFRFTSLQAQRGACGGISIIDKHHFTFLLLRASISLIVKFFLSVKGFFERVSYRNPSAGSPLHLVYIFSKLHLLCSITAFFIFLSAAQSEETGPVTSIPVYGYKVVRTYPHDKQAFTQGLFVEDGFLYEGTGLSGQSTLRKVKLETGEILKVHKLPQEFFGEGITPFGNKIIQLTWKSHTGFVYDKDSFRLLGTFHYPTEGWGITYDGRQLIMSDGTANLYFLSPETFHEIRRIEVRGDKGPVVRLNELEYIRGEIFANIWLTDRIARINPHTGRVTGWIDLKGLSPFKNNEKTTKALNGIAYDARNDRLFVTGKLWQSIYEIKVAAAESP